VDLADDVELDVGDSATLTISGVDHVGAIVSGGVAYGRSAYRIVAGADGWSESVSAQGYHDSAGVSVALVIGDAARLVGESVGALPSTRVGDHFARRSASAIDVLNALAPRAWYIDRAGVTQFGSRTGSTYEGTDTRTARRVSDTAIELETSDVTPYTPGVDVDGIGAALDVEYRLDASRLTVRVQAGPRTSRELDAFRRVIEALDPLRAYRACYEYRVVTQDGDELNLQPVRASSGMPDLARVPVRLAPGAKAAHALGSLVTVVFLDGDPSRPRVISGDDAGAPGWMPTTLELGDTAPLGVARLNDTVLAGPWAGTITTASSTIKAGS
jgi:hypothetical protein